MCIPYWDQKMKEFALLFRPSSEKQLHDLSIFPEKIKSSMIAVCLKQNFISPFFLQTGLHVSHINEGADNENALHAYMQ